MNPADLASNLRQTALQMEQAARALVQVGFLEAKARAYDADWDTVCIAACGSTEILHQTRLTRILDRINELVRENAEMKNSHYAMRDRMQLLEIENETLARNMPPSGPLTYEPARGSGLP